MNTELRNTVTAYAARRNIRLTAAVDEIALMLSCSRAIMYRWMEGKGQPSTWQQLILSMLALPPGVCINILSYPTPADDDLESSHAINDIMRRRTLAAAAMAGVAVHQVPFDRTAYEQWRGGETDTAARREQWAELRAQGKV